MTKKQAFRIVYIAHNASMYGANKSLINLIDGIKEFGHEISLICSEEGLLPEYVRSMGCDVCVVPFRNWFGASTIKSRIRKPARLAVNCLAYFKIKQFCKQWKPDIIHTNSSVVPVGAWVAASINVPHVWHIREMPLLHYELDYDYGRCFFKYWFNKASASIAISESVKQNVCLDFESAVHVIYNGLLLKDDKLFSVEPLSEKEYGVFSIIGLTSKNKYQSEAIQAVSLLKEKYPNVRLLIAGEDSTGYINYLKQLAVDLNIADNVEFMGYVEEPITVYKDSMAVLMCSRHEALGRVTAEAMAAARPVVGCDSGATPELISHRKTGYIYNSGADALAKCMEEVLLNPDEACQMGLAARQKAKELFMVEQYCRRINSLYLDITADI